MSTAAEPLKELIAAKRSGSEPDWKGSLDSYRGAQRDLDAARGEAAKLAAQSSGTPGFNDTNYIFLSFITHYLPVGVVGLVIGVIFSAAMSAMSGEINSLATVTVIDVYRRYVRREAPDRHYLAISKLATAFWGVYAIAFASYGSGFGALIEAVNMIGSLFYGGMLGVFVLAIFFKRVGANGAFFGVLAGEAAIFGAKLFTGISFLWYNVIGCLVVILAGWLISLFDPRSGNRQPKRFSDSESPAAI